MNVQVNLANLEFGSGAPVTAVNLICKLTVGTILSVTDTQPSQKIGVANQWLKVKDMSGKEGYVAGSGVAIFTSSSAPFPSNLLNIDLSGNDIGRINAGGTTSGPSNIDLSGNDIGRVDAGVTTSNLSNLNITSPTPPTPPGEEM
jgi:hypothetical protein